MKCESEGLCVDVTEDSSNIFMSMVFQCHVFISIGNKRQFKATSTFISTTGPSLKDSQFIFFLHLDNFSGVDAVQEVSG